MKSSEWFTRMGTERNLAAALRQCVEAGATIERDNDAGTVAAISPTTFENEGHTINQGDAILRAIAKDAATWIISYRKGVWPQ